MLVLSKINLEERQGGGGGGGGEQAFSEQLKVFIFVRMAREN